MASAATSVDEGPARATPTPPPSPSRPCSRRLGSARVRPGRRRLAADLDRRRATRSTGWRTPRADGVSYNDNGASTPTAPASPRRPSPPAVCDRAGRHRQCLHRRPSSTSPCSRRALRGGIAFSVGRPVDHRRPRTRSCGPASRPRSGLAGESLLEQRDRCRGRSAQRPQCPTVRPASPSRARPTHDASTAIDRRANQGRRRVRPPTTVDAAGHRRARPDRHRPAAAGAARTGSSSSSVAWPWSPRPDAGGRTPDAPPCPPFAPTPRRRRSRPGLALAGLVVVAAPASAAACSGTSGVTGVVDTGSSVSTRCAGAIRRRPSRRWSSAGFSVDSAQRYPGSVVCRINGYPSSDPCVRMPPGNAYWAFFHAKRGGSGSTARAGSPARPRPGTVVGFRFGSGQQPGWPRRRPPRPAHRCPPRPPQRSRRGPRRPPSRRPQATTTSEADATQHRVDAGGPSAGATRPSATPSASPRHPPRRPDAGDGGVGGPQRHGIRAWLRRRPRADADDGKAPARSSPARPWCCSWPAAPAGPPGSDAPEAMMVR